MGLNSEAIERATRPVASSVRPCSSAPMNWPSRSLSCRTRKRLKATLFSNSQKKVARSISASLEAGEGRGFAAARHSTHPGKTGDDAGPVVEGIATHENKLVGAIGFLH